MIKSLRGGKHKRQGFTIVELLIVIIVIGILAAVVIVAYDGTQRKARNVQRIAVVKQYMDILEVYIIRNRAYPASDTQSYCLGEGYPDTNADGIGDCGVNGSHDVNETMNAALRTIESSLPDYNKEIIIAENGNKQLGVRSSIKTSAPTRTVDGVYRPLFIEYYLEGSDQDCGLSNVRESTPTSSIWTSGFKNNKSDARSTYCIVSLPSIDEQ